MAAPANPVSGGAQEYKILSTNKFDEAAIIADDQNLKAGTLLSETTWGKIQALTNWEIVKWVSKELVSVDTNTYSKKANLRLVDVKDLYYFNLKTGTTIATTDIGKFYWVDSNHDIDWDTWETVPDLSRQFQLVEYKNTWAWVFRIVTPALVDQWAVLSKTVTLTTAQVLALNTTPITLIAAPGASKYIRVVDIVASIDYESAAYATNTTLEFRYTNGSGTKVTADIANLLDTTADKAISVWWLEAELVLTANAPVVATVATGDPVTWDSDVEVTVYYKLVDL